MWKFQLPSHFKVDSGHDGKERPRIDMGRVHFTEYVLLAHLSMYAQCFATTPASLACAVIRRLYACTEPSKCSIVPLSHTHRLVHTFCSIVTS